MDVKVKLSCENCGSDDVFKEADDVNVFVCSKCKREVEIEITCDKGYLMIDSVTN